VLDISHGEGGPSLRFAHCTGCALVGIDLNPQAIAMATALADDRGLGDRERVARHDAAQPLPFPDHAFDAVVCVDALVGLPDRPRIFAEPARDLKPSGRLVFTDPVLTGPLSAPTPSSRRGPPSSLC
jgi:SAM-dependent methyltransferase